MGSQTQTAYPGEGLQGFLGTYRNSTLCPWWSLLGLYAQVIGLPMVGTLIYLCSRGRIDERKNIDFTPVYEATYPVRVLGHANSYRYMLSCS